MSNTVSGEIDRMTFSEESRHRGSGPRLVRAGLEQTGLGAGAARKPGSVA